ncbi:MAG: hypothetical protein ACMUJM_01795 [bacterium]
MFNEDELFSSPESIITTEKIVDTTPPEEEKKSIGISGEATSILEFTGTRDWLQVGNEIEVSDDKSTILSSSIQGNIFFDARLPKGTKCFANLETHYYSTADEANFFLREFFIDFNIHHAVYFRTGKQVLQWGRCYLWNPSDLINVEKRTFKEKIGTREGAHGIKIHAPFGTKYNIYGFLDTGDVEEGDEIGAALKWECVIGKTEMAFSAWHKKDYRPVYAYDFSTRVWGIDTKGEAALSYGDNYEKLTIEKGLLTKYKEKNRWIPRICVDFGRSFDCMDVPDRISLNVELYYNEGGYTDNLLSDDTPYTFSKPITISDPSGSSQPITLQEGTLRDFLLYTGMYEAHHFSKYYIALFTTTRKFIVSDMQLILNMIGNLNDRSCILTSGIKYTNINDFSIGVTIYSYIGSRKCEYTMHNNAVTAQFTIGVLF